jgi:hypothetical protein
MKHFFLACLFPALLTAQTMQLTEQLGKTVLYDDIALCRNNRQPNVYPGNVRKFAGNNG